MEREYVESSMITSIGYDPNTSILEIEFKSDGTIWQYYDFPENLWYEFKSGSLLIDISLHLGSLFAIIFYFRKDLFDLKNNQKLLKLIIMT